MRTAQDRLRHYSAHFSAVEIDATYYAIPSASHAQRWVERTPSDFVFDVKAFAALTHHPVESARLSADLRGILDPTQEHTLLAPSAQSPEFVRACAKAFCDGIRPLHSARKLGSILLQFPPWMHATRDTARWIEQTRALLSDMPVSVEFRHHSWTDPSRLERVLSWLRALDCTWVCVDAPQGFSNSTALIPRVTTPAKAILRLHGRRRETWARRASVLERFDYLYAEDELRPLVGAAKTLADQAETLHVVFNNCREDFAVANAKDFAALLSE